MILTPEVVLQLAAQCAPHAAAETLLAVARAESGLDSLAIGVNGVSPRRIRSASRSQAVEQAGALIAGGANVDLGLAQINSANLSRLRLSVADAFDPCRSLAASATLLQSNFQAARPITADDQPALRTALSLYNTGDARRGFRNGYVARVERWAAVGPARSIVPHTPVVEAPAAASWDVFSDLRPAAFVISPSARQGDPP